MDRRNFSLRNTFLGYMKDKLGKSLSAGIAGKLKTEAIIEAIGDAVNVQDVYHKIVYQNEADKKLFGNHVGEFCFDALKNFPAISEGCPLDLTFADGRVHKTERVITNGTENRYIEITVSPLKDNAGRIIAGIEITRDVTQRVITSQMLKEKISKLQILKTLYFVFNDELSMDSISRKIQDILPKYIAGVDRTSLLLYDESTGSLVAAGYCDNHWDTSAVQHHHSPEYLISYKAFSQSRPVYIKDCSMSDMLTREEVNSLNIKASAAVPVIFKQNTLGVLRLDSLTRTETFSASDLEFFTMLGEQLGIIIENIRLFRSITQAEKDIRQKEERLNIIFNNISDIIITLDADFNIVRVSPSVEKETGYAPDELIGKAIDKIDILSDYSRQAIYRYLLRLSNNGNSDTTVSELIAKNGESKIMEITGSVARSEEGPVIIIIARNVTERYRAEEEIQRYYREVVDLNEQLSISQRQLQEQIDSKDKFFSILSHDLKGPFSSLLGFSDFLMSDLDSLSKAEIQQFAESINTSSRLLYKLVDNLLQWSLMQTGKMELNPAVQNLREIVASCMIILKGNALKKKITLNNTIDEELTVYADQSTISSVIQNLISNAIKFTNPDGIVTVSARECEDGKVEIGVSDTGVGMTKDELAKLFRVDIRHTTNGTHKEKGTGIGLIVTKELIEKNGGNIRVESMPGNGSTFYFTLPARQK